MFTKMLAVKTVYNSFLKFLLYPPDVVFVVEVTKINFKKDFKEEG